MTLHALRIPARLDLDPNDLAHIHRRLPTQRVRGRSLFRSIEKLSDPNEVTESQVACARVVQSRDGTCTVRVSTRLHVGDERCT
jgi:capsid protein